MSGGRGIDSKPSGIVAGEPGLSNVPLDLRATCGEKTYEVRHVSTADHETSAMRRVSDKLRNPSNGLCFDLRRRRRQLPSADVRIDCRSNEVRKHTDRRRAGSNVAPETRMCVEQGMVEEHVGDFSQQIRGLRTGTGQASRDRKSVV